MTSLTSGGSWTNDQHTGEAVDPTGLTFEVHYADGTSASVSPQAHTPSVWGDTAGTQTCTFTYTEDGESVSCAVEATVTEEVITLNSLTYSGSLTNDQINGSAPDLTGLTFTAHYSDSSLDAEVTPTSILPATYSSAGSTTVTVTYTDEYGTASVEIEVTVIEPVPTETTITGLSVTGTMPAQTIGDIERYTGLDFAVSLSNGQTVHLDWDTDIEPASWTNPILGSHSDWIDTTYWVWQEYQGSDTVTDLQFYIDPDENGAYWASQNVVVSSRVTFDWPTSFQLQTPVLRSLSVSGDFTDIQYTGVAPTKTGLTFTASYSNGTSDTVSASDITVTPATWDASGNPNNLGEQTATFSYTEGGVTKTATKSVVIHRPSSGQVLNMDQEGWLYFDVTDEIKTLVTSGSWGPSGLIQGRGAAIGAPAFFVLDESSYQNDTPITAATLSSWMPLYGLGSQGETFVEVGTPNQSGFKPSYGVTNHTDLVDSYAAIRTDGTATMSAGDETVYMVIGTLANALDGTSYKLSDMDVQNRTTYTAIMRKS